jgi:hypothetical protein
VFDLTGSLVWDFSAALLVTVAMLLIPTPVWERFARRGPPASKEAVEEEPVSSGRGAS